MDGLIFKEGILHYFADPRVRFCMLAAILPLHCKDGQQLGGVFDAVVLEMGILQCFADERVCIMVGGSGGGSGGGARWWR